MRAKSLCTQLAVSGGASTSSTPILLIAGGHFAAYGDSNVPGEDMAFPSSGNAVVALSLEAAADSTGSGFSLTSGGSIFIQTSNNYYSDSGSGETFATVATYAPSGGITGVGHVVFLDKVPLGEAVLVKITSVVTADVGYVTATLLNN